MPENENPICYICGREVSRDHRVVTFLLWDGTAWISAHHECSLEAWKKARAERTGEREDA